jgi:hypothetical protein
MLCLVSLAACSHSDPFSNPQGTDQPFDPGPPARLTLNPAHDGNAAWLADGSGIVYSAQQLDRADHDVCLAELPPAGGSHRRLDCDVAGERTTTDAVQSPAPALDGRLAFVSAGNAGIGGPTPVTRGIAISPTFDARNGETVRTLPFAPDGGEPQDYAGYLGWLTAARLVYVGQRFGTFQPCPRDCPLDTVIVGTQVTVMDIPGGSAAAVPGTLQATGVAPIQDGAAILYTLFGDTRIYSRVLSSGAVGIFHDFGPGAVVRDVNAGGNRVAAVVAGRVGFSVDPNLGATQWDSGGILHVLELDGDGEVVLDTPERLYRRPAVSPDGNRIVAEGFPLSTVTNGIEVDTIVGRSGDLYLFGAE